MSFPPAIQVHVDKFLNWVECEYGQEVRKECQTILQQQNSDGFSPTGILNQAMLEVYREDYAEAESCLSLTFDT